MVCKDIFIENSFLRESKDYFLRITKPKLRKNSLR